jgi:hypothetical protein
MNKIGFMSNKTPERGMLITVRKNACLTCLDKIVWLGRMLGQTVGQTVIGSNMSKIIN